MKFMQTPVLVILAAVPLFYVAIPLLHLFLGVNWHDVAGLTSDETFLQSLWTSLAAASCTTLLAVAFGLPTAFLLSVAHFRGKRFLEGILILPLVLPPIVSGTAQLTLYGPNTGIGAWFASHGISLTDSLIGVVLAQSIVTSPFLIFAAKSGFDAVPGELLEVTRLLGGGIWTQLFLICVPLSRSAIFAGMLLTFARAVGEFGATMMVAYHPYTVPVDLWVQFSASGIRGVLPIAVVLAMVCLFVVAFTGSYARPQSREKPRIVS